MEALENTQRPECGNPALMSLGRAILSGLRLRFERQRERPEALGEPQASKHFNFRDMPSNLPPHNSTQPHTLDHGLRVLDQLGKPHGSIRRVSIHGRAASVVRITAPSLPQSRNFDQHRIGRRRRLDGDGMESRDGIEWSGPRPRYITSSPSA